MAATVSTDASILAVIQAGIQVRDTCSQHISSVANAPGEIHRAASEVASLLTCLCDQRLLLAQFPKDSPLVSTLHAMMAEHGPVESCRAALTQLTDILGTPDKLIPLDRAIVWPLKEKAVQDLLHYIQQHNETIALALAAAKASIKAELHPEPREEPGMSIQQKTALSWLSGVDPSTNHNLACDKHVPSTGNWLLESHEFSAYLHTDSRRQCLWCYGIPGCGKTILLSTAVEHVKALRDSSPTIQYAYFYFDFQDLQKQASAAMLRSVLAQLASQNTGVLAEIGALFANGGHEGQQPQLHQLLKIWSNIIHGDRKTYILLDALDECSERESLMKLLSDMFPGGDSSAALLVTSRREQAISDTIGKMATATFSLESSNVGPDIGLFIQNSLASDGRLSKWPDAVKEKIHTALVCKAHERFRWVECQLRQLRRCLRPKSLEAALETLPTDLDETYLRIIASIPDKHQREAVAALRWLAFSFRPMSLAEVAEALAVTEDGFDTSERLFAITDVLDICSGLVSLQGSHVSPGCRHKHLLEDDDELGNRQLRLAHYSVKEFLLSERVELRSASREFALSPSKAHHELALTCIRYLTSSYFETGQCQSESGILARLTEFPFLSYAASFYGKHINEAGTEAPIHDLIVELLLSHGGRFLSTLLQIRSWTDGFVRLPRRLRPKKGHPSSNLWASVRIEHFHPLNEALDEAAGQGLNTILRHVVNAGADIYTLKRWRRNALAPAAAGGHHECMHTLLELEANTSCPESDRQRFKLAGLIRAIQQKQDAIVDLLLEKGTDPTRFSGLYHGHEETALSAASSVGSIDLMEWLLKEFPKIKAEHWHLAMLQAIITTRFDSLQCLVNHLPSEVQDDDWKDILWFANYFQTRPVLEASMIKAEHQMPILDAPDTYSDNVYERYESHGFLRDRSPETKIRTPKGIMTIRDYEEEKRERCRLYFLSERPANKE